MVIPVYFVIPILLLLPVYFAKSVLFHKLCLLFYAVVFLGVSVYLGFYPQSFTEFFAVDALNTLFLVILAVVFLGVALYNLGYEHKEPEGSPHRSSALYTMFFMLFVFSMAGMFLSTHLGLLWVFLEATTLTSSYLIYASRNRSSLEAVWKYIFICSIGIALAFVGIILISIGGQGKLHSLFFKDLYEQVSLITPLWLKLSFAFMLLGFGTKMGLSPVHAWLPDAHSEAPSPVSAMLSGTLLNVALFAMLKAYRLMQLAGLSDFARILMLVMGLLSLLVSAVFVIRIGNYKRMLAYSSVENMGIINLSVAVGAFPAALLHTLAHSLSKASFFLSAGNILHMFKTKDSRLVRGLLGVRPLTAWLLIISFLALSGFPPFPVFFSEFFTVKAFFATGHVWVAVLFFLFLTIVLFGMGRTVFRMCFGSPPAEAEKISKPHALMYIPQILFLLLLFTVFIPGPVQNLLQAAGESFAAANH